MAAMDLLALTQSTGNLSSSVLTPKLEVSELEDLEMTNVLTTNKEKSLSRQSSRQSSPDITMSYNNDNGKANGSQSQIQNQPECGRSNSRNNYHRSNEVPSFFSRNGPQQPSQVSFGYQHSLQGPTSYTQPGHMGGPPLLMQQIPIYQGFQTPGPGKYHGIGSFLQPMQPPHGYVPGLGAAPRPRAASHMPSSFNDQLQVNTTLPTSSMIPGAARVSEAQLNVAYGYGFYDISGRFVRLVPADTLQTRTKPYPEFQGPEGLIILPRPRAYSPQRRAEHPELNDHMVPVSLVNEVYEENVRSRDAFGRNRNGNFVRDPTQTAIDSIVNSAGPVIPRRQKIYCDKWIHEGICAFTQLGCKYKHEMPSDKATQISLGLGHGYPKWYKDKMSMGARILQPLQGRPSPSQALIGAPPGGRDMSTSWRNNNVIASGPALTNGGNASGFGPIAPPNTKPSRGSTPSSPLARVDPNNSNNIHTRPQTIEEEANDVNQVTFKGRRRSRSRDNNARR